MRITKINDDLILKEYKNGLLFGTDALLLSRFACGGLRKKVVDLGSGSGVIGLLMLAEKKAGHVWGVEIQKKYAELAEDNARTNGLSDKYTSVCNDLNEVKNIFDCGFADVVVSNPPYMKTTYGKKNISEEKMIARHEVSCNIDDVCKAASWCLKYGGDFFIVHRPERLSSIMSSMKKYSIEPKKLLIVSATSDSSPSLVLVSGRKDASEGLVILPNIYLFKDEEKKIPIDDNELKMIINKYK